MSEKQTQELTKNQQLVYTVLTTAKLPLSAYMLLDELRSEGFRAPLQVYRALEKLLEYGLVHRLESINSFVACQHNKCCTHTMIAFAICKKCKKTIEFSDDIITGQLNKWANNSNFILEKSTIEISGNCQSCIEN